MNYRCDACDAHYDTLSVYQEKEPKAGAFVEAAKAELEGKCPYCGEHQLTSIEGEDETI